MTETNQMLFTGPPMEFSQYKIFQHQGYFWKKNEDGWVLTWNPIPNVYSPPLLHPGVKVSNYYLQPDHLELLGHFIGKNGVHLKNITKISKTLYIYVIENRIEIWGNPQSIRIAFRMIRKHLDHVISKVKHVQIGYDYLPISLRPPKLESRNQILE